MSASKRICPEGRTSDFAVLEAALAESEAEFSTAQSPAVGNLAAGDAERRLGAHLANVATAAALCATTHSKNSGVAGAPDGTLNPEEQLAHAELLDLVRRTMNEMAPDEAGVIRAYYFESKSMGDIAAQENLSKSWVCRLHAQAMGRLTRRIKNSV